VARLRDDPTRRCRRRTFPTAIALAYERLAVEGIRAQGTGQAGRRSHRRDASPEGPRYAAAPRRGVGEQEGRRGDPPARPRRPPNEVSTPSSAGEYEEEVSRPRDGEAEEIVLGRPGTRVNRDLESEHRTDLGRAPPDSFEDAREVASPGPAGALADSAARALPQPPPRETPVRPARGGRAPTLDHWEGGGRGRSEALGDGGGARRRNRDVEGRGGEDAGDAPCRPPEDAEKGSNREKGPPAAGTRRPRKARVRLANPCPASNDRR